MIRRAREILSRTEVLALLSQKAREGSTSAMIALERSPADRPARAPRRGRFHRAAVRAGYGATRYPARGRVARREARSHTPPHGSL